MNQKLSQLARQLVAIWRELGLNQRISIIAAAVIVVGLLASLGLWSGRADYALLYGKLDDAEAAKVTAVLDEAKIPYKLGAGSIHIPADKVHLMRMQLASRGIPRGDGVGFEIFDKPNFGISDFVQRANYLRAVQGELARTISQLDEVESARVMIVQPENQLLTDNNKRPTASVFVRIRKELSAQSINSIRFMVANSVEGLQPSQVSVVDNRGQVLSENSESDSLVGLSTTQLMARRNLEQYLAKKTEGMLDAVLGPGQSVVRVAADLNFDTTTVTEEKFDPESQVIRISTVNDESTDNTGGENGSGGGVAGVISNLTTETNTPSQAPGGNRLRKKVLSNQYEISRSITNVTQVAGGVKRLSAAVFVAARYEGTGTTRKLVPRAPEELEKLRRIVMSALGLQSNQPGTIPESITLEEMPFTEQFNDLVQEMTPQEKKQFWFGQIQTYIYPVLALGIFFIFWRALKKTPVENVIAMEPAQFTSVAAAPRAMTPATDRAKSVARGGTSPVISVEAFNQLVRENPSNLTQAIQSWLDAGKSNRN